MWDPPAGHVRLIVSVRCGPWTLPPCQRLMEAGLPLTCVCVRVCDISLFQLTSSQSHKFTQQTCTRKRNPAHFLQRSHGTTTRFCPEYRGPVPAVRGPSCPPPPPRGVAGTHYFRVRVDAASNAGVGCLALPLSSSYMFSSKSKGAEGRNLT